MSSQVRILFSPHAIHSFSKGWLPAKVLRLELTFLRQGYGGQAGVAQLVER
ncbi:MAG: hypothetical protein HOP30_03210 [Cyclobacteriaceae bacterium]|nr:hypothetical protein [Cyclobacteriaceae bacterium]